MSERKQKIKNQLHDARTYLNAVLDHVDGRWDEQVYSEGLQWTVRQIVNHLADADKGHNHQVMNIAEGRDIIPEDFDVEYYNRRVTEKTQEKTAEQSRADLAKSREALLAWLDEVDDSKLDREGRHASLQVMTVEAILSIMSAHERGHAQDIARELNLDVQ